MEVGRVDGNRPWAPIVGYSRAVRMGNLIEVSGTSATTRDGQVMFPHDAYGQMKYILTEIEKAVKELGATFENTIRTRVFLTNIEDWPGVAKAHGEFFANILHGPHHDAVNLIILFILSLTSYTIVTLSNLCHI